MPLKELDPRWYREVEQVVEYVSLIDSEDNLLYVNRVDSLELIAGRSVYDFVDEPFHDRLREAVSVARAPGIRHR